MKTRESLLREMKDQAREAVRLLYNPPCTSPALLLRDVSLIVQALYVTIDQLLKMEDVEESRTGPFGHPISDGLLAKAKTMFDEHPEKDELLASLRCDFLVGFIDTEFGLAEQAIADNQGELFFSQPVEGESLKVRVRLSNSFLPIVGMEEGHQRFLPNMIAASFAYQVGEISVEELVFGNYHGAMAVALKSEINESE